MIISPFFYLTLIDISPEGTILCLTLFAIASLTDWLDGFLARKLGLVTRLGKFLDPLADKVLTSFAFWGFYILGMMELWMVVGIIVRDIFLTLYRVYEEIKGKSIPANQFAQWKTATQMIIIIIVLISVSAVRIFPDDFSITPFFQWFLGSDILYYSFLFVTAYTIISGLVYLYQDFMMNLPADDSN